MKSYKLRTAVLSAFITLLFCAVAWATIALIPKNSAHASGGSQTAGSSQSEEPLSSKDTTVYIAREYEGKIGLYREDEPDPFQVLNVRVTRLPKYDRDELQTGIRIYGVEQLNSFIENFD